MAEIQLVNKHACIQEGRLGVLEADDKFMQDWQTRQNGSLQEFSKDLKDLAQKVSDKTDRLQLMMIGLLVGIVFDLILQLTGVR